MLKLKDCISRLDTKRFGLKVAKVDFRERDNVTEIVTFLKQQKIALIITKVRCQDVDVINQLEELGFKTMDFQVAYDYYGTNEHDIQINRGVFPVRKIRRVDIPQLVRIAENSFDGLGHYFADKRLDRSQCLEVYKDWTRNVCTKRELADVVFAAYDQDKPIGFLAVKAKIIGNAPMATVVIAAVSSEYAGKKVFQSLLLQGIEWAAGKNLKLTDIKIHTTNYPPNGALAKLGFEISGSSITMHYWNDKPPEGVQICDDTFGGHVK